MGNDHSTEFLEANIRKQFETLCPTRGYLTLSDLSKLEMPEKSSIKLRHLPTLYCLDSDKTGRFSLEKFLFFLSKISTVPRPQVYCSETLLLEISRGNSDQIANWLIVCLRETGKIVRNESLPPFDFVHLEFLDPLYWALGTLSLGGLTLQNLFHFLQLDAEENGLMPLSNPLLDEFVPLETVAKFIREFLHGYLKIFADSAVFEPEKKEESAGAGPKKVGGLA